jgi:hypothetical protein
MPSVDAFLANISLVAVWITVTLFTTLLGTTEDKHMGLAIPTRRIIFVIGTRFCFSWGYRHMPILGAVTMINDLAIVSVLHTTFSSRIKHESFHSVPNLRINIVIRTSISPTRYGRNVPLCFGTVCAGNLRGLRSFGCLCNS